MNAMTASIQEPRLAFIGPDGTYIVYLSGELCDGQILHGNGRTFYECTVDSVNGEFKDDHEVQVNDHRGKSGLMRRWNGVLTWDDGLYYPQPGICFPHAKVVHLSDVRRSKYLGLTVDRFYVLISAEYTNDASTYQLHIGSEGRPMQRIELTDPPFVLSDNKFPVLKTVTGEMFSVAQDGIQTWGGQRLESLNLSSYTTIFNEDGGVALARRW